ncbi:hypothetical protein ACV3RS_16645 [Clostridium perfringens]
MNKKSFIKFFSLLLTITFFTTFKVFANEINNKLQNETFNKIEVIEDNKTTFKTKSTFSSGRIEIVTINKENNKVLVEENNKKLAEYSTNEIVKITNDNNSKIRTKRDNGNWYQVNSWPRTNIEADYKRVSAVVSTVMMIMKIPTPVVYEALNRMYRAFTGEDLPTVFGYLSKKWEFSGFVYKDKHNSSNGKVVYHYWFDGVWKDYYAGYFTWS